MPQFEAPTRLLVCADDLTGANDIGVQFAKSGIHSIVLIDPESSSIPKDFQVVVVNTESRHLPPGAAAARIHKWAELGRASGITHFYKKTDSTLRGNIGAELQAIAESTATNLLPFTPALPELGRTTRHGIHYVDNRPLHETEFASDPLNPITTSSVTEIIRSQSTLPVSSLHSPGELTPDLKGIAVLDATSPADLEQIASALAERDLLRVCAGPAGFGLHLANHLPFQRTSPPSVACGLPILFVNGSLNERSLTQIAHASFPLNRLQLPASFLLADPASKLPPAPDTNNLLIYSITNRTELNPFLANQSTLSVKEAHHRVAQNTGRLVQSLLHSGRFGTLVVFGGDTLMGIARANHWQAFVPLNEVVDGITISRLQHQELTVISKAGGFGAPDVLDRIYQFVRSHSAPVELVP